MTKQGVLAGCALLLCLAIPRASRADLEPFVEHFHGRSAIPAGSASTFIASRSITKTSVVFVTVDVSASPAAEFGEPRSGLQVRDHDDGYFEVTALDGKQAPAGGIAFNWVVFNPARVDVGYYLGHARLEAGKMFVSVPHGLASLPAAVLLTVDTTGTVATANPGLQIVGRGPGRFLVAALDGRAPSKTIPFNYLVATSGLTAGTAELPQAARELVRKVRLSTADAVFLTVEQNGVPHATSGLEVLARRTGEFTVTALDRSRAVGRIPFTYVIVSAHREWEEYGPTALSGLPVTIAVHPRDGNIQYTGSSYGGIWKTRNGGKSWRSIWQPSMPLVGVISIILDPKRPESVYAMTSQAEVLHSDDSGTTWTRFPIRIPGNFTFDAQRSGGVLAVRPGTTDVLSCTSAGVHLNTDPTQGWTRLDTMVNKPDGSPGLCSDIAIGRDGTLYVGYRSGNGVWMQRGSAWKSIKLGIDTMADSNGDIQTDLAVRLAVGSKKLIVNYECKIFINKISNLYSLVNANPASDTAATRALERSWVADPTLRCGGSQNNNTLVVAVSPEDDNNYLVGSRGGQVHTLDRNHHDVWTPIGTPIDAWRYFDYRQAIFTSNRALYVVTDAGHFTSSDGGLHPNQTSHRARFTDGPPLALFQDLTVSKPDQFKRAYIGGNVQDQASIFHVGRISGIKGGGAEGGVEVVAPQVRDPDNKLHSTFRVYTSALSTYANGAATGHSLTACDFTIPGPDFKAPEEGYFLGVGDPAQASQCVGTDISGEDVSTIAVADNAWDHVLVGTRSGRIFAATPNSNGLRFELLTPPGLTQSQVSTIYFASDHTAYFGLESGMIKRIDQLYTEGLRPIVSTESSPQQNGAPIPFRVVQIIGEYGKPNEELYVAYGGSDPAASGVYRRVRSTKGWSLYNGGPEPGGLTDSLTKKLEVVGLARSLGPDYVYVATGHNTPTLRPFPYPAWDAVSKPGANVFRSHHGSLQWLSIGAGIPAGLPITGIAFVPETGLFISSYGRGIWWRRDIEVIPDGP